MLTTADQAKAVIAEVRKEAVTMGHKMANGFRGEVVTNFRDASYKCVYNDGRVNWYIDGKRTSEAKALAAIENSLKLESERVAQAIERAKSEAKLPTWDVIANGGQLELSVKAESLEVATMRAEARLTVSGYPGAVIESITEVIPANMTAQEISDYILRNWYDINRVPKCVNDAHLEAGDNTLATFQENGQESTPDEFYAAYLRNLEFVLTCTEFGTAQACEWYKARGVKF